MDNFYYRDEKKYYNYDDNYKWDVDNHNDYWVVHKQTFLDAFQNAVKHNLYKRIPYSAWRQLFYADYNYLYIMDDCDRGCYAIYGLHIDPEDDNVILPDTEDFDNIIMTCSENPYDYSSSLAEFITNNWNNWGSSLYNQMTLQSHHYASNETSITNNKDLFINNNTIKVEKEKENKIMKTDNLFNFEFGPASSNQFRMSPYGIAVRTASNGWVSYNPNTGEIFDVDILNFDISKLIFKMPVALNSVAVGDILIHSDKPVFVRSINANGTVSVVNYADATVVDILPVKSPFGFNFFTKVCALIDFNGATANADNPFGNMLPFLMLAGNSDGEFDPTLLFMVNALNGNSNTNNFMQNPMALYFLMNRSDKRDILPLFMMANNGNMFGIQTSAVNPLYGTNNNGNDLIPTVNPLQNNVNNNSNDHTA